MDSFEYVYSDALKGWACLFRVDAIVAAMAGTFAAEGAVAQ